MLIFITFRNHRQKFLIFHIYKCRRFRKSNNKWALELGLPAEWQHSKVSQRNVTQTRKTSKAVKINQMLYSVSLLSGIIGKKIQCYFTSTRVTDSENEIKIGHRNLESQQNDNIPRSVSETSLKQEKLKMRSKSSKCYIIFIIFAESKGVRKGVSGLNPCLSFYFVKKLS